ncbi:MAG: CARDB domain-containing protein [Patescibacteria group bacterium]
MRRIMLALLALGATVSSASAGFNALYDGVPDLELTSFVQKSARTFTMVVCNRGDTSNGIGSIVLNARGTSAKSIERTISGVSIQAGRCQTFEISSAGTFGKPYERNYNITTTIRWDGNRREMVTDNNQYVLKPSVAMTDGEVVSTNPSRDLWNNSNSATTWYKPTNTNYTSTSTSNTDPINFSPSGPFYGQTSNAGNVIYIYRDNGWYYGSNGNYVPCPTRNEYYRTNTYNTFDYVNGSNGNYNYDYYYNNCYGNYYNNCNGNNCNGYYYCTGNNCNCGYNNSNCYNNDYSSRPDLVVNNIKQNGSSREFVVNICNRGASMFSGTTTNVELTAANTTRSVNVTMSLAGDTCQDVYVQFNLLNMYYSGYYTTRAVVDTINAVRERDENNNSLTVNTYVNYN